MNITTKDIRSLVTSTIYSRGLGYYRAGHVHLVTIEDDYFFAEVSGTYDYEVRVNSKGHVYHVECNCPYWDNCKHIVAAMLEAKDYYDSKNNYLGQNKQTSWQQYFEKAILKSKYAEAESKKWQLLYCIDFKKHYWTILPRKAYVKRDGSFGRLAKISQWDINNEEVQFNSSDALILTHLEKVRVNSGSYFYYEDHLSVSTQIEYGAKLGKLIDLLHQSRLYLSKNDSIGNPITFDTKSVSIEFRITEIENGITMTPYVKLRGKWIALNNEFHVLSEDPIWLFYNKEIFKVKNLKNPAYLTPYTYKTNYVIFIPTNDVPEFFNDVLPRLDIVDRIVFSDQLIDATISEFSGKRIYLEQLDDDLIIHPKFMYGTIEVSGPSSSKTYFTIHPDKNSYVKIIRNQAAEEKVLETLILSGVNVNSDGSYRVALKNALDWLIEGVAVLLSNGFEIYGEDSLKLPPIKRGNPRISVAVNSGIDWFDLKLEIDIDNTSLSIAEIRSALRKNERFVKLADGSVAKLPDKWLRKFRHLINLAKGKNDELYFTHYHTTLIDELFKDVEEKQYSNSFKQELKKFNNFGHTTPKNVPLSFQGSLRSYQKTGYDWLLSLKELKFGGCLADDMGLGKTIQTLVLLLYEYENGATAPSLIIAPVSIIFN